MTAKRRAGGFRLGETIQVRNNLRLIARERGKIVARREGHNIWLDLGREYLASLIADVSFGPDVPERNDRIKYMELGIGGTRQGRCDAVGDEAVQHLRRQVIDDLPALRPRGDRAFRRFRGALPRQAPPRRLRPPSRTPNWNRARRAGPSR